MAPILTIFGPNRSRRPKLKFEKKFRAVVAVVVGVVVVDRRGRRRRLPPCPSSPLPSKVNHTHLVDKRHVLLGGSA